MQDCPFWQPVITVYAIVKAQPPQKHRSQTAQKAVFPPHQQKQVLPGYSHPHYRQGWSLEYRSPAPTVQRGMQSWNSSLSLINVCCQLWTVITTFTNIQGWHFESGPSERSDSGNSCPEKDIKCFQWGGTGRLPTFHKTVSSPLLAQTSAKVQPQKIALPALPSRPTFLPPPPRSPPPEGRQSSCSKPHGSKLWPQPGAGQLNYRNKLKEKVSIAKDKNFWMRLLAASLNSMGSATANPV